MQILVVEDDVRLAQALCRILEESGYKTDAVHDGQSGLDYAESGIYDVVILDVMLPKMDGFTVVSNLRRAGVNTPVLLLTARDAVPDKICGLDSGADDYMTKPFSPAELMAHLRALTRRQGEVLFEAITSGDVSLNLESHDLTCGDQSIHLSYKEFSLARVLMANAGAAVSLRRGRRRNRQSCKRVRLRRIPRKDSYAEKAPHQVHRTQHGHRGRGARRDFLRHLRHQLPAKRGFRA